MNEYRKAVILLVLCVAYFVLATVSSLNDINVSNDQSIALATVGNQMISSRGEIPNEPLQGSENTAPEAAKSSIQKKAETRIKSTIATISSGSETQDYARSMMLQQMAGEINRLPIASPGNMK